MKHPRHGGRVLLEREEADDEGALYRVTLYTSESSWSAAARLARGGGLPELGAWAGEGAPPDWLVDGARAHLRTLQGRAGREGWPRKVLRWRAPR